jgi:hypothetical protein
MFQARGGRDLYPVCTEVARQLEELGYRRPYGQKGNRGNDRINGRTIRRWRTEAMESRQDVGIGLAYRHYLEKASQLETEGISRNARDT